MNWSLTLGILGIVVSIVVGWVTYRLADRRARNQRHASAKTAVLRDLSNSLGEDSIPTPEIIDATIRSVLREVADPKVDLRVDEVLDDLVRQVTSDPFLDSERRRKLQKDIQEVRTAASNIRHERIENTYDRSNVSSRLVAALIGLLATVVTLLGLFEVILNESEIRQALSTSGVRLFILIGIAVATLVVLVLNAAGDDVWKAVSRWFRRTNNGKNG